MGSHLEALVRQLGGCELIFGVDNDVENAVARFADEMLVLPDQRIEVLGAAENENLQLLFRDELLQVSVHGAQTDARQTLAHLVVDLVRGRMRFVVFNGIPDDFKLPSISRLYACFGHDYAARSSASDFCTSGRSVTLA